VRLSREEWAKLEIQVLNWGGERGREEKLEKVISHERQDKTWGLSVLQFFFYNLFI
jgi:hypothetical protein